MDRYNKVIGGFGERKACEYLESIGYRILRLNYNCRFGEIDIVAMDIKLNSATGQENRFEINEKF